jgi:hypothetical protein
MAFGLGVPGLYRLGAMSAQVRHLDTAIREDITPELRGLREGVTQVREGLVEMRTETKQLRADMDAVRHEITHMRAEMAVIGQTVHGIDGQLKTPVDELRRGQQPRTGE